MQAIKSRPTPPSQPPEPGRRGAARAPDKGAPAAKPLLRNRGRSYNQRMLSWRCPHCGSPQTETARCWVCRRSTTSCASCRHFRNAVSDRLGYCVLDKLRVPLTGEEERACWERAATETATPTDRPTHGAASPEPPSGSSLWGGHETGDGPDRAAVGHGLWSEPDSARDLEPVRNQHGSSIRSRPWGPVPGQKDGANKRRGVRLGRG